MSIVSWIVSIIVLLIVLAVLVVVFAWFYQRASNEVSLIKTGIGGKKAVLSGGTLVLPYFNDITRVNMKTLRLDVQRAGEQSLITKDRMRVDVGAEFYTSVAPTHQAVERASQTLGDRTFKAEELHKLISGMMVDALRSVAAQMTMDELHENRSGFATQVQKTLAGVLDRYGLQIDAVSLTSLDQTPFSALDENNAFNAVGMRKLAEVIATSRKERAKIDADAEVSVRRAAMEAEKLKLGIELDEQRALIEQQQEIETLSAHQVAEIARQTADSERAAAAARIDMEKQIEAAEIEKQQARKSAEQDRQIALYKKSMEESRAEAEADEARAEAVKASEAVQTAIELSRASRNKQTQLLSAEAEALSSAKRIEIAAQTEVELSGIRAQARKEAAEVSKLEKLAEAEAHRALMEAENARSDSNVTMELEKSRLEALPKIVSEMVKPAEKIKSININHLSGVGNGGSSGTDGNKAPVNQALDSIMDMAVQLPVLNKLGESVGVTFQKGLANITDDERKDETS